MNEGREGGQVKGKEGEKKERPITCDIQNSIVISYMVKPLCLDS